jgi:hypothetical protein
MLFFSFARSHRFISELNPTFFFHTGLSMRAHVLWGKNQSRLTSHHPIPLNFFPHIKKPNPAKNRRLRRVNFEKVAR